MLVVAAILFQPGGLVSIWDRFSRSRS
jgi:hypothetical protein